MAIYLAERVVDGVVAILQSDLATELGAIDTERNDGITLAAPANAQYTKYPLIETAGSTVHVEVFEGSWSFGISSTDANDQRATFDIPITVRLSHFNRDNDDSDTMMIRMRRYQVGLFNVINKNYDLGGSDPCLLVSTVTDCTPSWEIDDPLTPRIALVRASMTVNVKVAETQA